LKEPKGEETNMRKTIALAIAVSILGASPSLNQPARATAVEYAVMLALIIVACIDDVRSSDLPPAQKERLIHNLESWKSLPPTKQNGAYIQKNSAQIRKLLATASNPKSQAALQKYTTTAYFKVAQPSKVQVDDFTVTKKIDKSSPKLMLRTTTPHPTTTATPSALNNPSILGSGGAALGASGSTVRHTITPVTPSGHQ
jgi:hypothetical protein